MRVSESLTISRPDDLKRFSAEEFHNTPETQTDESYNHPEDIEHFAQHEAIERREAEKEAAYQGISVEEALASHEHQPADDHPEAGHPPDEHAEDGQNPTQQNTPNPKVTRVTPPEKQDPVVKFQDARAQMIHQDEWGTGYEGFKAPKSPVEKMRKNLPYKVCAFYLQSFPDVSYCFYLV